ncbi:hypothetical protein CAPTEDRAFT_185693 [Capitella teleta]|nr:hypothetical protein CAPTEDRAFT_185693 [Capitella teleta]|eukprot:ELT90495.1 hypothetical protein CAPTEDRAFT_185693 [Capitella teleta]
MFATKVITGLFLVAFFEGLLARGLFPSLNWETKRSADLLCTDFATFSRVIGFLGRGNQVRIGGAEVTTKQCTRACSTYQEGNCVGVNLYGGSVGPCKLILSELVDDAQAEHFDRNFVCGSDEQCYTQVSGKKFKNPGPSFVNKVVPDDQQSSSSSASAFCMSECDKYDVCVGFDLLSNASGEYEKCSLNTMILQDSTASAMLLKNC